MIIFKLFRKNVFAYTMKLRQEIGKMTIGV